MEKLNMSTSDAMVGNVAKIAEMFPNCISERKGNNGATELVIDFDKLRAELSTDATVEGEERYQFTWPDKRAASRLANTPTTQTLRPDINASKDFWNTENLYLEGDNLEVLKILRENYLSKIKVIYIDPPYNTGGEFVYNDDFAESYQGFLESCKVYDENGNLQYDPKANGESNGRFHTDWLNMIYPRLKVARDLLAEDGVMFISIDDNELTNLRKVCEEIFGERNIECLIWNKVAEGSSGTLKACHTTRRIHEYIVCCFKNLASVSFTKIHEALKGRENEFQTANLAVNADKENPQHPNYFTITNPTGDKFTHQWKWDKAEIDRLISEGLIYWGSDGHKQPRLIIPTDDRRTTYLQSILDYGGTTVGRKDFERLLGDVEFTFPKPVILIKKLIETSSSSDSIVLDFFSGSATTAHAVMKLNAEDRGHRKFIMVQLPEITDEKSEARKAGFKNICQIGEERIRRAGEKMTEKAGDKAKGLDTGFRVLRLDSSNMEDVFYTPEDFDETRIIDCVDNVKPDRTPLDLLFQVMPECNIELSAKIRKKDINDKNVFFVKDGNLIATFDTDVDEATVTAIAKMKPQYFIMRDASAANDNVLDNFDQIFKHYSPDTIRKIL